MQKRILPYLVAIVVFALLTIVFFIPVYQGKVLSQGDITQWEGMSKELLDWNKAHPQDQALWTSRMFGGMPAVQIAQNYPGNYVTKIVRTLQIVFPDAVVLLFMTFVGFYILLLCLGVNPWLALAGSIAYGLSSFIIISLEAGHNTKVQVMSLMAPVLGGVILSYKKNILLGAALTALFLSMAIDSNHLQIAYYLMLIIGVIALYYLVESALEKRIPHFIKASALLIVAALLAIAPNAANLWATQEYAKETIRGGSSELTSKKASANGGLDFEYASRWSYGLADGEILSLLIPNIKGGASGGELSESSAVYNEMINKGVQEATAQQYIKQMPLYWGGQPFTSGPVYFGAAVFFLFLLSLFTVRNNLKWALLSLIILSILLASGHNTPFYQWMFNLLPFFNKFRTPSMALVIAELAVPLLAILALNDIINGKIEKDELLKKMKIAGGITAAIVLVFGVFGGMFASFSSAGDKQYYDNGNGWLVDAIKQDRASLLRADAFRSLFFVAAAFGLIWFYIQKKFSTTILISAITVVFLLDGWMVDKRYLNDDNFKEVTEQQNLHAPTQADIDILKDTDPNFRVFNVTRDPFNDAMTSYYHKAVGGYHPAKLFRYQDLIENQISKNNVNVLNMLNTKYYIGENPQTKAPAAQLNPTACGNAWFVSEIKWAKNADQEMAALTDFNPKNTVVIDERFKSLVGNWQYAGDSSATIKLTEFTPNRLTYSSTSTASELAVFSEIYYNEEKGWHAFLDGKEVEHFRANYVLRAMVLPSGSHKIEFKFEPQSYIVGNKIALAGSILLYLFVLGTLGYFGYSKFKEIKAEPVSPTMPQIVTTDSQKKKK